MCDENYQKLKTRGMSSHPSPKYPHRLDTVIPLVIAEYDRAKGKHGENTPDGNTSDLNRLATLTEELGEVARCMTYDRDHAGIDLSVKRRTGMRKYRVPLSMLVLFTLISTGCMFRNVRRNAGFAAYVKAAKAYSDESAPYALANRAMIAAKSTLSPEQLADYTATRAAVRTANLEVHSDLTAWELDGIEPAGFKAHHAALRAAQERMILLAGEVAGGGSQ